MTEQRKEIKEKMHSIYEAGHLIGKTTWKE